jgi:hypothetical protein
MKTQGFVGFLSASALVACTAGRLSVGGTETPDSGGSADARLADASGDARRATCGQANTYQEPTSLAAAYAHIQGSWIMCANHLQGPMPPDVVGMEFGPPSLGAPSCGTTDASGCRGNLYYLVYGPSGPVRGPGFSHWLTYEIAVSFPSSFRLILYYGPVTLSFLDYRYSECPAEIEIVDGTDVTTLVPLRPLP